MYLLQLAQELTHTAFEIHDRQILSLLSKGRKAQEEIQRKNGKKLNEKIILQYSNQCVKTTKKILPQQLSY